MNNSDNDAKHVGLLVAGYKPQNQQAVDRVNTNKHLEELILRELDSMLDATVFDQRWLAIGRTHLEQAFMAINRAAFKPERVKGPIKIFE